MCAWIAFSVVIHPTWEIREPEIKVLPESALVLHSDMGLTHLPKNMYCNFIIWVIAELSGNHNTSNEIHILLKVDFTRRPTKNGIPLLLLKKERKEKNKKKSPICDMKMLAYLWFVWPKKEWCTKWHFDKNEHRTWSLFNLFPCQINDRIMTWSVCLVFCCHSHSQGGCGRYW